MSFSHCLWLLSLFCGRFVLYAILSAILSFAIISLGKRELVALLSLRLSYDVTPGNEITHAVKSINHYSCKDVYSYSCLHPLSNEQKSMFKSGDSRAV